LFLVISMLSFTTNAFAQMPPKARTFLSVCGYGAGGGALLGFASMAFGTNTRAIPIGASLGLYAGIIFGGYVLLSHKQGQAGSYDRPSPYSESTEYYDDGYGGDAGAGDEGAPDAANRGIQSFGASPTGLNLNLINLTHQF
jgi:hypothetical protein